jgi:hypothetical protein
VERIGEIKNDPGTTCKSLKRIYEETARFILKIKLRQDNLQSPPALTIHTIDPHGRTTTREVQNSSEISDIFPSLRPPPSKNADLLRLLQTSLSCSDGLVVPFDRGRKFHILCGSPLIAAKRIQAQVCEELAKKVLEDECHETVRDVARAETVLLRAQQADSNLHKTGGTQLELHRKMSNDWSAGLECIEATIALNLGPSLLSVEKTSAGYCLMLNHQRVYRVADGNRVESVSAWTKRDRFSITTYSPQTSAKILSKSNAQVAVLRVGDFITEEGVLVVGEAATTLGELFEAIRAKSSILPSHDISRTLSRLQNSSESGRTSNYYTRHWTEDFIKSFSPESIESGALQAEGQWKIFVFPNKDRIIAEADHVGAATYVGTLEALPHFVALSRTDILQTPPRGFIGRILHQGENEADNEQWKQAIRNVLA